MKYDAPTYDSARRLQSVGGPSGTFTYSYKSGGSLWTNLALPYGMRVSNHYDSGGRLTGTYLRSSAGTVLNQHAYLYNSAGQRQRHTKTDGSYTTFGYDYDAQLTSALGYTSGGSPISSEQLGFGYDAGWNLASRSVNGAGTSYTVNDLNQLTAVGTETITNDVNGNLRYWGTPDAIVSSTTGNPRLPFRGGVSGHIFMISGHRFGIGVTLDCRCVTYV